MKSKKLKPKYGKFEYAFPDDKTLKEMRDKFTYPEGDISNIVAPPNATEIDLFKIITGIIAIKEYWIIFNISDFESSSKLKTCLKKFFFESSELSI